jgi:large subunit ribosomal protein L15
MVVSRSKKNVRQRGRTTHGWGSMKKHRGAGNRSGRGNAGRGKRSDHKKPTFLKKKLFLGKRGFKLPRPKLTKSINLETLEMRLHQFVKEGKIVVQGDRYLIDKKLGYDKILGSGKITTKFVVNSVTCSKKAQEKINQSGGEVVEAKS